MNHYAAILVDEMNVINQLHRINVHGFSNWTYFYQTIARFYQLRAEYHFFCANVENSKKTRHVYKGRQAFFNSLREQGLKVHEGFTVLDFDKRRVEKGVDVLLALEIYKKAVLGVEDIFICSADSDLIPAVREAQKLGSRIHLVISDYAECARLSEVADSIISLELILEQLEKQNQLKWRDKEKPFIIPQGKDFKTLRKGVVA